MSEPKMIYDNIAAKLVTDIDDIAYGKMMSSPAITFNKKVFAFYYKEKMVFKLGKEFDFTPYTISDYELLNPFKNKPPLAGWYVIDAQYSEKWEELALLAYDKLKNS
ncbi:hypothetical protein [Vallitalea okinawensis]|uniref:hypothetical protein n=1 Tax=Vallitalea okinawensis TaxID=2078660 RepID=UPI000CFAE3AE|nr:hypothetical protein [Vallitalea okinawensis]